ncbi:MAG: ABC transporter permease [Geminicoccaceae bacterium]
MPTVNQRVEAIRDLRQGIGDRRLWLRLAWLDIRQRYRRSTLGPFWLTLSMGITVVALGVVWGSLFGADMSEFLPFLATGLILWGFVSSVLIDSCTVFIGAQSIIKEIRLPLITYVLRMITRNAIIMAHNAAVLVGVYLFFGHAPSLAWFAAIPGLAILAWNAIWVGGVLGLVNTRYRDVQPVVQSLITPAFLITPIMWQPEMLPERALLLHVNPFFATIEVIRAPLLGKIPAFSTWLLAVAVPLAGSAIAFTLFARYRRRVAFWL